MIQATTILVSTIIGVGILPLPLFAVRDVGSGAPMVTLAGTSLAFIGLWLITVLGMRFPDKSIVEYSAEIIGKWPAAIGSVCIIIFFAVLSSLTAREFGEVVITSVLKRTPLEVTVFVMLLLSAISTRHDMRTFAYIHNFYVPLLLIPALLIVALSLKNADVINLLPVWGTPSGKMFRSVFTVAALFQASFVMTIVIPAMRQSRLAMKASIWSMIISGMLYITIVTATIGVFGAEETKLLLWPTLELAKTTSLPANILERLDAAFLGVWVTAVFTTLFSTYYFTIRALSNLFHLRDHKMFSFSVLPFVFILAMLPESILHMYEIIQDVGRIGLVITIFYPALLLVIAMIRKKRGDRGGDKTMDPKS
ncbi:spore gernimation protein [Paenibacillus sp. H1-7]|uniref:GerAB/ArcD/ProY family transporter n=1 Tax=Paenibacillus sp. H1-7 TaxID=2282849 RepID=UPI001EF96B16|nr:endospore germination permease [Paenibacillus sp. H1-7]ULL19982.1 spore gernimation protein [Paenibacillus sp. H1-7]